LPQPREVRLRGPLGEDTGLLGVAPWDRGQLDQDSSNNQHDTPAVNQGRPASNRQISRSKQIHLQVRRAESTFPQDTAWCERLRVGTRTGGSLRITQAAAVRLGHSHQSRPFTAAAALHRRLAICSRRSPSPRAKQGGHDPAVSSLLRVYNTLNLEV
jgi:hypothetical protein